MNVNRQKGRDSMTKCDKPCIANVGGDCAVAQCKGQITMIARKGSQTTEQAARFYEIAAEVFDEEEQP